jgi:hypothetical protein
VNQDLQNEGVELFIRRAAEAGVELTVDAHATGQRLVVPLADGSTEHVDVLRGVTYVITGTMGGDPVSFRVRIEIGAPPNGTSRVVESTIPREAPGGDILGGAMGRARRR